MNLRIRNITYSNNSFNKTDYNVTFTAEGPINHLRLCWEGRILDAPVRVRYINRLGSKAIPERLPSGELVYALPGGWKYSISLGVFKN